MNASQTDFNDLHQLRGAAAVRRCVEEAQSSELAADSWLPPEPLGASFSPLPFPVAALPTIIREAVQEVIDFVQAPVPLAAGSALSAVSVALQGLYDVQRAPGLTGVCSLYLLSIADSGERKSSCDGYFRQALESWQQEQETLLKPLASQYQADIEAWESQKAGIKEAIKKAAKEGKDTTMHKKALRDLELDKPASLRLPCLIRGDDTPENLGWALMREWPSAGVLSSEAGIVFGSHGMGGDSITRNLALLNVLWDGGAMNVGRRTSDSYRIERVRLTMGLQVQEATLRAFFDRTKGLARGTGFLARFLMAWPTSTMGKRFYTPAPDWHCLGAFNQRIRELLACSLNMDKEGRLATTTLVLSPEAHEVWVKYLNAIEAQLAPDGDLEAVKDVASKSADNAARLAALFHVFEQGAGPISANAMARGAQLAAWYLHEARRFLGQFAMPVELMNAERLDRWLIQYCRREACCAVSTQTIMQYSPLRDKASMLAAVSQLEDRNRARLHADGKKKMIAVNPALLQVKS
jgi:putative DNA primase/helicase